MLDQSTPNESATLRASRLKAERAGQGSKPAEPRYLSLHGPVTRRTKPTTRKPKKKPRLPQDGGGSKGPSGKGKQKEDASGSETSEYEERNEEGDKEDEDL